jgi:hypothetical protein
MVFDFKQLAFTVYFDGDIYQGENEHKLKLISRYNNKPILNGEDTGDGAGLFDMDIVEHNDRYTEVDIDFTNTNLQTEDIEGLYDWEVIYDDAVVTSGICKVFNSSTTEGASDVFEYTSDNEDNEQYTFYK